MEADGGFEVAFHGEFREVVTDERLVLTEVYEMPGAEPLPAADEPLNIVTSPRRTGARRSRSWCRRRARSCATRS